MASNLVDYAAGSRQHKSVVVRNIVDQVQDASPFGGFVKKDKESNQWCVLDTVGAIEKVGHVFRDLLRESHTKRSKFTPKEKELCLRATQDNIFMGMNLMPSPTSSEDVREQLKKKKKKVISSCKTGHKKSKDGRFEAAFEKLRNVKRNGKEKVFDERSLSVVALPDKAYSSCTVNRVIAST